MLIIKLSDEDAAALGVNTEEAVRKLLSDSACNAQLVAEADAERATMQTQLDGLKARIDALEKGVAEFKAKFDVESTVDAEAIRKECVEESTKSVMALVAKIGAPALPSGEQPVDASVLQPPADDDYKAQWDSSPDLRAEFTKFDHYEAYKKAMAAGAVKIFTREPITREPKG